MNANFVLDPYVPGGIKYAGGKIAPSSFVVAPAGINKLGVFNTKTGHYVGQLYGYRAKPEDAKIANYLAIAGTLKMRESGKIGVKKEIAGEIAIEYIPTPESVNAIHYEDVGKVTQAYDNYERMSLEYGHIPVPYDSYLISDDTQRSQYWRELNERILETGKPKNKTGGSGINGGGGGGGSGGNTEAGYSAPTSDYEGTWEDDILLDEWEEYGRGM